MYQHFGVSEIFYSLQGEGYWVGRPAIFVRMAGCNLHCPFCDTDSSIKETYTAEELLGHIREMVGLYKTPFVVWTGGEPNFQPIHPLTHDLRRKLHPELGKIYQAVETNGTLLGAPVNWTTLSPKRDGQVVIKRADELKIVLGTVDPEDWVNFHATYKWIQPMWTPEEEQLPIQERPNVKAAVDYVLSHPQWRLSLQCHKLVNIR